MSTRTRQAATAPIHGHLSRPAMGRAVPVTGQRTTDIQAVGTIAADSVKDLNQILADTMTLRDLYKKHHWQLAGGTFHQLHRLFDKHCEEQVKLIDDIAARIQALRGREEAPVQLSRLLEAHEIVIREIRQAAETAADHGDDGTNDLLVSGVLRTNELHVWFLAEHLADIPVVRTD